MNYAHNGEFVRGTHANQVTSYCVSIYAVGQKFDELPKHGESPFWCKTQKEAVEFVTENINSNPDKFTYAIRKLEVTHT